MAKKIKHLLKLGEKYYFELIEKVAKEYNLFEKVDGMLSPLSDDMPNGAIGDIVLPLYFEDGTVACNFILTGYGATSYWKCIYVCESLSRIGRSEI